jgi:hypothetical protein
MEQDQWLGMVGVYRRSLGLGHGLDWIGLEKEAWEGIPE